MTDHDAISQAPRGQDPADTNGGPGNIDQIRDIIFGAQMRDYDRRFLQLEERLLKDSADLREELGRRHTALEAYIRREIEALSERLVAEQRSRAGQIEAVTGNLDQLGRHVDGRFGEAGEETNRAHRELRGELVRQATEFDTQLQRRSSEFGAALKREADELHTRKADRAMLGALFADLAARLAEELKRPNDT